LEEVGSVSAEELELQLVDENPAVVAEQILVAVGEEIPAAVVVD